MKLIGDDSCQPGCTATGNPRHVVVVRGEQIRQEKSRYHRVMRAIIRAVTLHDISSFEACLPQSARLLQFIGGVSKPM